MLGCLLAVPARAAAAGAIPRLEPIPAALSEIRRGRLVAEKTEIDADYLALDAAAKRFNTKEGKDQTDQEFAAVTARRTAYIARVDDFNGWVKAEVERLRVIQAMATYLGPLGTWKSEEKKRALDALEKLDGDGDGKSGSLRIQVTWERILARQPSAQLLALAARDGGPGFPGARRADRTARCSPWPMPPERPTGWSRRWRRSWSEKRPGVRTRNARIRKTPSHGRV
jgi:hypothetical protein